MCSGSTATAMGHGVVGHSENQKTPHPGLGLSAPPLRSRLHLEDTFHLQTGTEERRQPVTPGQPTTQPSPETQNQSRPTPLDFHRYISLSKRGEGTWIVSPSCSAKRAVKSSRPRTDSPDTAVLWPGEFPQSGIGTFTNIHPHTLAAQ
jgi:hypothetical protein